MITQSQIKINLPTQLKNHLKSRADKYGIPVTGYVKHLILKDIENADYPTFIASKSTENDYKKALEDEKKAIAVKGEMNDFLDNL